MSGTIRGPVAKRCRGTVEVTQTTYWMGMSLSEETVTLYEPGTKLQARHGENGPGEELDRITTVLVRQTVDVRAGAETFYQSVQY